MLIIRILYSWIRLNLMGMSFIGLYCLTRWTWTWGDNHAQSDKVPPQSQPSLASCIELQDPLRLLEENYKLYLSASLFHLFSHIFSSLINSNCISFFYSDLIDCILLIILVIRGIKRVHRWNRSIRYLLWVFLHCKIFTWEMISSIRYVKASHFTFMRKLWWLLILYMVWNRYARAYNIVLKYSKLKMN